MFTSLCHTVPALPPSVEPASLYAEFMDGVSRLVCLLIHGFASSLAQWRLHPDLLGTVCRPAVAELWGHGRSPAPNDPTRYKSEGVCAEFAALRQRLGIGQWFVIGQSLGIGLALGVVVTNSLVAFSAPESAAHAVTAALDREPMLHPEQFSDNAAVSVAQIPMPRNITAVFDATLPLTGARVRNSSWQTVPAGTSLMIAKRQRRTSSHSVIS